MFIDMGANLRPSQKPTSDLHFGSELSLPAAYHTRLDERDRNGHNEPKQEKWRHEEQKRRTRYSGESVPTGHTHIVSVVDENV